MTTHHSQHSAAFATSRNTANGMLIGVLLLASALLSGCQTARPSQRDNSTLKDMQEWTTPEPLDRLSPANEQTQAKAAMVQWLEQYLKHAYRVTDQRFVLTQSGFTASASIGSKANQYVTQKLGGVARTDTWLDDDNYALLFWTIEGNAPRHIAFVVTGDFVPGTKEQNLVGYFELSPSRNR